MKSQLQPSPSPVNKELEEMRSQLQSSPSPVDKELEKMKSQIQPSCEVAATIK